MIYVQVATTVRTRERGSASTIKKRRKLWSTRAFSRMKLFVLYLKMFHIIIMMKIIGD